MSSTYEDKGLRLIFGEVGDRLSESELNKWFAAHAAERKALPGWHCITHLVQNDGQNPKWLAMYELASPEVASTHADQVKNNENMERYKRQRNIADNIGFFDRRIYKLIEAPEMISPNYQEKSRKEGGAFILFCIDVDSNFEDELTQWYNEEHINMLSKIPGWLRSRRYVLVDSTYRGTSQEMTEKCKPPPKFLAVHEYEKLDMDQLKNPAFEAASSTLRSKGVFANGRNIEKRLFKVYKAY